MTKLRKPKMDKNQIHAARHFAFEGHGPKPCFFCFSNLFIVRAARDANKNMRPPHVFPCCFDRCSGISKNTKIATARLEFMMHGAMFSIRCQENDRNQM